MTGKELKKRLKMTGKTLVEISQLLGMSSQALNQILNAQDVKSGTIETLSDVLQIPIYYLYGTPSVDVSTTSGNGNITLNGNGNTNNAPADCQQLLAAKDAQIDRLLGIIERLTDEKE